MRDFNVQLFELQEGTYKIALSLSSLGHGAQGTKDYASREAFASDLNKFLGFTDGAIERFFSDPTRQNTLLHHPLTDEDAASLGWAH